MRGERRVKKLICTMLILSLIGLISPFSLAEGEPAAQDEMQAAIDSASDNPAMPTAISLGGDIILSMALAVDGKYITIDVANTTGSAFSFNLDKDAQEAMTITGGSVTLTNVNVNGPVVVSGGATLIIGDGASVKSNNSAFPAVVCSGGSTVALSGGRVEGGIYGIDASGESTVNAVSGFIYGSLLGIKDDGTCSVTIEAGAVVTCDSNNPATADIMKIVLEDESGTYSPINISLDLAKSDYNIDIPGDPPSYDSAYTILPDTSDTGNAVVDAVVTGMHINGSSSNSGYGERNIHFSSELGAIVVKIDVTICYVNKVETYAFTLNLFQPKFIGLTIAPDIIAGDESILGVTHSGFRDSDDSIVKSVFFGAETVDLILPETENNNVKGFTVTDVDGDGASYVMNGDSDYTINLSSSLTNITAVHMTIELSGGVTEDKTLFIEELAIFQNSSVDENFDFVVSATYNTHRGFPIADPKLVKTFYHEYGHFDDDSGEWAADEIKSLWSEIVQLPDKDDIIELRRGNLDANGTEEPNVISVFIISGDPGIDTATFGGVKYGGDGFGWTDILPNHPMISSVIKDEIINGGKKK